MDKKYIITLSRRGRKRAVEIRRASVDDAFVYMKNLMQDRHWTDAELYENDSITPAMEDGFSIVSSAHMGRDGKIKRIKPITVRR